MSSFKLYRIVTTTTSTPINFVTGTTATSTAAVSPNDKGCEVTFQNQSTSAVNIYIASSSASISIGATSTLGVNGIALAQNGTYAIGKRHAPVAIQMLDYWVLSTSSNAICVAHLVHAV